MNAGEVRNAVRKRFEDSRRYAIAEEVGLTTGGARRRIDMIVIDCYHSNGFRIDGIEIKVSTADLRRELEDPDKHVAFFDKIDYYTLACPKGVAEPLMDVIPKNWGLLIVSEDGVAKYKRKPLALEDKTDKKITRGFFASVTRAILQHQPSAEELQAEYDRGVKYGTEAAQLRRDYMKRRVDENIEKLEDYEKLQQRFKLWRDDDIEKVLDEFEAFRNLDLRWTTRSIEQTIEHLSKLQEHLMLKMTEDEEGQGGKL